MTVFLLVVVAAGLIMFVGALVLGHTRRSAASQELRFRRDVLGADQEVRREYREARRAMNDAAGQAWRNLTD